MAIDRPGLRQTGALVLDLEILAEAAVSLGNAGRRVEEALTALASATEDERETRLRDAARAVHHYFIQRELRGFRRHDDAIAEYAIPPVVIARLGVS